MDRHVFLIGMMGCGKSTIGRLLSQRLGCPLLDLDEEIARFERRTISEIFADSGDAGFRVCETAALRRACAAPPCVVASMASSRSINGQESSADSRRPTVLLPQPIMPMRKMCLSMAYPFAARYAPSRRQFSQSLASDSISTFRLFSLTLPVRST